MHTEIRQGVFHPYRFFALLILAAILMTPQAHAAICGYPEKGSLVVSREGQTVVTFQVALAETRDQYRQGLMGCHRIAHGTGLLFIYPDADRRVFWMKNTPLELAILFVSSGGYVLAIEKGHPNSTRRIRSPDNIQYVLEINYAEAGRIRVGDQLTLRLFPQ